MCGWRSISAAGTTGRAASEIAGERLDTRMAGQSGAGKADAAWGSASPNWASGALGVLLVYGFTRSLVAAAAKPFGYDELLTEIVAAQGTWHRITAALMGPTDGQPPLFYVIEHFVSGLCRNQQ